MMENPKKVKEIKVVIEKIPKTESFNEENLGTRMSSIIRKEINKDKNSEENLDDKRTCRKREKKKGKNPEEEKLLIQLSESFEKRKDVYGLIKNIKMKCVRVEVLKLKEKYRNFDVNNLMKIHEDSKCDFSCRSFRDIYYEHLFERFLKSGKRIESFRKKAKHLNNVKHLQSVKYLDSVKYLENVKNLDSEKHLGSVKHLENVKHLNNGKHLENMKHSENVKLLEKRVKHLESAKHSEESVAFRRRESFRKMCEKLRRKM
ncbi:UNVERIFIED_CONTAM: hypothetical protein RMT77_000947 [Armadillidium vulgare]